MIDTVKKIKTLKRPEPAKGNNEYSEMDYSFVFDDPINPRKHVALGIEEHLKRGGTIPSSFAHNYIAEIFAYGSEEAIKKIDESKIG